MQISRFLRFWKPLAAVAFFLLLHYLLSYIALSSFFSATIEAEFDHPDEIGLYYASSVSAFHELNSVRSGIFRPGIRERQELFFNDGVARKIRLDLGREAGQVRLYRLTLKSHYGSKRTFGHRQLHEAFAPGNGIRSIELKEDHVLISTEGNDPFVVLRGELKEDNNLLGIAMPLVYALAFFLLLSTFNISTFPAIADLREKTSSSGLHIGALDGIRGFAALVVLAEHTGVLKGIGSLGVWLFFALSGFLLSAPFIRQPSRAVSPGFMGAYLTRRLKRILPMYYAFLVLAMMMHGKTDEMVRHLLFLQGDGHLWTLPQEMFFYMVLPLVVAALYLLLRGRQLPSVIFLLALTIIAHRYTSTEYIALYGYGKKLEPMLGNFLTGMMIAYLYHWLGENRYFLRLDRTFVRHFCSVTGLVLLLVLIVLSARLVPELKSFNALRHPGFYGFAAGLFILLVVLANNTLLSRVMSFTPLRAVGLVSFSFYLLHPTLIGFIRAEARDFAGIHHLSGLPMFLLAGIATYCLAAFTYTYIERPFLKGSVRDQPQGGSAAGPAPN